MLVDDKSCASPQFSVDVSGFAPGGVVAVTVSCTTSTAGLEIVASRGHTYSATAYATIDRFRGTGDTP